MPQMHTPLKRELFKLYIRFSSIASKAIITISENSKQDINKYFPKICSKTFVTPLGVAANFYTFKNRTTQTIDLQQKYNLPSDYILYVGTIEPRKNVLGLIKAYEKLPDTIKEKYKLVLCGKKGWLYEDLFAYYEQSLDKDNIVFSGFIEEEDLPYLYHQASLFTYISHYEGFGIPLIESMACGTPLITSNTSSMKEIAEGAALLVNPDQPNQIAESIVQMLTHSDLQAEFKTHFEEKLNYYNWENCAKKTLEVIESVL
jgi:glycosyltransferase involved in cell wall biosynthesis